MRVQFDGLQMICPAGSYNKRVGVTTFEYNNLVGIMTITTNLVHGLNPGMQVKLERFEFACSSEHAGVTTTFFPDGTNGRIFNVVTKRNSTTQFETQVGVSTINHIPTGTSEAAVEIGVTTDRFPSDIGTQWGISGFDYTESIGVGTITTKGTHGIGIGSFIRLANLEFTCDSEHAGVTTTIFPDTVIDEFEVTATSSTTLTVNVGPSTIAHTYVDHSGHLNRVTYADSYLVDSVVGPTTFVTNVNPVGFAHTYIGGGSVDTGFTTTRFPDNRGIPFAIDNFEYDKTTGFSTITLKKDHSGLAIGDVINLSGIALTCSDEHLGVTTTIFPDGTQGFEFQIFGLPAANKIITNVGVSTIGHNYDDHGIVFGVKSVGPYEIETIVSPTEFVVDVFKVGFAHTFVPNRRKGGIDAEAAVYNYLTFGSGYFNTVDVVVEEEGHSGAAATVVATINDGGVLSFTVEGEGSGYTNPSIQIQEPSYSDLSIQGVSRSGIGSTTETGLGLKVDCIVGSAATVGVGTDLFGIVNYQLSSPGFSFKRGDIFTPVGLVTAAGVGTQYSQFNLEVLEIISDTFSSWNFGQIDYIDSISSLQDGVRTRFPLNLNGIPLSFQTDPTNQRSAEIDLDSVLLIFVNGVVQVPKKDYFFEGGTSFNFNFTSPPISSDVISIYFYRGTRGTDSFIVTVFETVKPGDQVGLKKFDGTDTTTQDERTIFSIKDSTDIETNVYRGQGIEPNVFRPITFTRQKKDIIISEQIQPKIRETLEAQVMPTSKIIGDFGLSDSEIFLESIDLFRYEQDEGNTGLVVADGLIVKYNDPVAAAVTASVSTGGTITALTILSSGSGYADGSVEVSIANPSKVDNSKYGIVGVGTTAVATGSASGGILTSVTITNEGLGYDPTNPPKAIVEFPAPETESVAGADVILGYAGIITGIGTTTGTGSHPLAIKLQVDLSDSGPISLLPTLLEGYPILVKNTVTGSGVTSVNADDSAIVGIGTTVLDNIYTVNAFNIEGNTGIITCNIKSDTNTIGIATTTGANIGEFSWGKLSGFTRGTIPISISVSGNTVDVGLTTFPSIKKIPFNR
jgi:hypothetical protein